MAGQVRDAYLGSTSKATRQPFRSRRPQWTLALIGPAERLPFLYVGIRAHYPNISRVGLLAPVLESRKAVDLEGNI